LTKSQVKRLNALMQTCGFYDESGGLLIKWDYQVSGIGGGIVALYPKVLSLPLGLLDLTEIQSLECTLLSHWQLKQGCQFSDKNSYLIFHEALYFFMIGKSKSIQNFFLRASSIYVTTFDNQLNLFFESKCFIILLLSCFQHLVKFVLSYSTHLN
jgi:hypothetical protein